LHLYYVKCAMHRCHPACYQSHRNAPLCVIYQSFTLMILTRNDLSLVWLSRLSWSNVSLQRGSWSTSIIIRCSPRVRRESDVVMFLPTVSTPSDIRRPVSQELVAQLVHSFVLSRLDYGNSVLVGLPKSAIMPLQRVQSAADSRPTDERTRDKLWGSSTGCPSTVDVNITDA